MVAEIINAPKLQYMMGFYVTWFGKAIVQALVGFMLIIPFVDVQDETIGGYTSISFIVSCIYNLIFAAFLIVMGVLAIFGCNSMKTIRPMMAKKKKKKGDGDDDDDDDDDDDEDEEDDGENEGDSNDSDSSSSDDSS